MKDQKINFKTAKLAKEKGFSFIQRYGNEASLYSKKGEHTYYSNYGFMYSGLSDGYISAPTQSLLQKWLREEHKLDINVMARFKYNGKGKLYKTSIYTYESVLTKDILGTTYEEALEKGLQEALKLI